MSTSRRQAHYRRRPMPPRRQKIDWLTTLPAETLQIICSQVFTQRSILFEASRKKKESPTQTRPEEWQLALLRACKTLHENGLVTLKKALTQTTVIYRNCLPSEPTIRSHCGVTNFSNDERRAQNFVRYYSYYVMDVQVLGWPSGDLRLEVFGRIKRLTFGSVPIWLDDEAETLTAENRPEMSKLIKDGNFAHEKVKDMVLRSWERQGRWSGGPQRFRAPLSDRPQMQKIIDSVKEDSVGKKFGKLQVRNKRRFELRCRVVVDFTCLVERGDRTEYTTMTGFISGDGNAPVLSLELEGHLRSVPEHALD